MIGVARSAVVAITLWGAGGTHAAAQEQHEPNQLSTAITLMDAGDREGARNALNQAMKKNPHDAQGRMLDAVLLALEGRLRDAESVLTKLIEDHPGHVGAHRNLAMIYAAEERLDEALTLAQRAVEMEPSRATLIALGDMHLGLANRAYRNAGEKSSTLIMAAPQEGDIETTESVASAKMREPMVDTQGMGELIEPSIPAKTRTSTTERMQSEVETLDRCRTIAREPTLERALARQRTLARKGIETSQPRRAQGAHTLRWVLSEGRMKEWDVEELLRVHGERIGEIAVVNRGRHRGRGSYGVFAKSRNAERRTAQLSALGVSTVTEIEKRDAWDLTERCEIGEQQGDRGGAKPL